MTDAPDMEPLEALARAYDREDASQRGEPDPWKDAEDDAEWVSERLACAQVAEAAYLAARSAPEAGKAVVKPLDLSNLLRHAFMFGFETMGGTAEAAKDWWPVYNPEECPAFERILSALASSPTPTGAEPVAWMVLRKDNLHLPVLTSREDADKYQLLNPEETLQPLYASPQLVAPTGEIAGLVAVPFGLNGEGIEALRSNGLKPEEIAGDPVKQAERVRELLHWFVRLSRGSANPKWTRDHAFELAYYIATTDDRAPIDTHQIEKDAWLKGVKATHAERDQMLRLGFITQAEFDAAKAPQPPAPTGEIAGHLQRLAKVGFGYDIKPEDRTALREAATALTSLSAERDRASESLREVQFVFGRTAGALERSEAEAADLRRKLEEARKALSTEPGEAEGTVQAALAEVDALEQYGNATSREIRPAFTALSRLREALKPFALVAERDIGEDEADADRFQPMRTPYNRAPLLTVGDLRAAARALSEREGQE